MQTSNTENKEQKLYYCLFIKYIKAMFNITTNHYMWANIKYAGFTDLLFPKSYLIFSIFSSLEPLNITDWTGISKLTY